MAMKMKSILVLFVSVALVVTFVGCLEPGVEGGGMIPVVLRVVYDHGNSTVRTSVFNGTTVFDLLNSSYDITYSMYPEWGAFIESIEGVANTDETFWMYYINGSEAPVGVSLYRITESVEIEFRYQIAPELL